jgi:hypothetical protein|uniref:Uncharacterized protein n=1 Tax=Picea glauca TaxID=3330 RepID=A0A124GME4_PICGL|nr:hypothetical protein ABT39_MTgene2678 [Picea glauca]QHR86156.1 hypothetical protein Q903MT_gene155 [Picea sitchensis]
MVFRSYISDLDPDSSKEYRRGLFPSWLAQELDRDGTMSKIIRATPVCQRISLARPAQSGESQPPPLTEPPSYDIMQELLSVPARVSMYDLLRLAPQVRKALATALQNAEQYAP